jgi:glycosyltransferase involved in cell wall biosynthesis
VTPAERPARVFLVINDLQRAGAETQLVRLAAALPREHWEPQVVLVKSRNDFEDPLRAAGVPVTALAQRGSWDVAVAARLHALLRRERPDVVHSFLFFASLVAAPAARLAGVPAIVVSQRCSYDATLSPFWRGVARRVHRLAGRVIVNSEAARREELAAGFSDRHVTHVPNGIDIPAEATLASREALGLPVSPLVVCVGRFSPEKRHQDLVDAWTLVRQRVPDAVLALVGDGPLRAEIEASVTQKGLAGAVRFCGFQKNAAPYIAAADIVVVCSSTEGMPNAVLEAMAHGRCVVATRVGGIPELVVDGETGRLVPPLDVPALGNAIADLLGDAARREAHGAAGRARARDRFAMPRVTAAVAATYEELLGARR